MTNHWDATHEVDQWFAIDGPLSSQVKNYLPREGQIEMARAVHAAIETQNHLLVEAGTGTGKTFAYLLPVLMAGKKAVISTGTRNLQDQLFHRDLPTVTAAFGAPVKVALLKGRSNYVCLYRLQQAAIQPDVKLSRRQLGQISSWSRETDRGDISELSEVGEGAKIWPAVTSTTDNCLGQDCPAFNDCFVVKARRSAQAADVVIVNHHLLLADIRLKEDGFGELLPGTDVVVLDEAHQFPDTAANFFGSRVSSRQIIGINRDVITESFAASIERDAIEVAVDHIKAAAAHLRQALGRHSGRKNLTEFNPTARDAVSDLASRLFTLEDRLRNFDGHSNGLDSCRRRARDCAQALLSMLEINDGDAVAWVEVTHTGFQFQRSPLDVSEQLHTIIAKQSAAWIFTSATLAVGQDFTHYAERVGLVDPKSLNVESTFDYKNNSLLYIPEKMPQPSEADFTARVVDVSLKLLEHLHGGAFLLFTSYRALQIARQHLSDTPKFQRTLFVQGDRSRDELLREFREDGQAVLLGTSSFWEGVDVRGSALGMVVIDKLPFASPGDPLLQARLDAMKKQGGNPFMDYQLPQAVLGLKQGVGRLIRDVDDRGLCVVCDPRIISKGYGRQFLASLPPMPMVRSLIAAKNFVKTI